MLCRYNAEACVETEGIAYFASVIVITDTQHGDPYIEGPSSKNDFMSPLPQGKRVFFWIET
jgi:hypothetical protein